MKDVLRRLGAAAAILACVSGVTAAPPLAAGGDLAAAAAAAAERGAPLVLVFTRPDCAFCARAKKEHLEPLAAGSGEGAAPVVREIVVDDAGALRDFDGRPGSHAAVARRYGIGTVPTVLMVDARGRPLAAPLVGFTSPDFYGFYLERALGHARRALRR